MPDIHFSNYLLEEDQSYFLYIGELKNYSLNSYLCEALTRIFNRKFNFIAIVPDLFEQYNYDNIIVINPLARSYACRYPTKISCRVSADEFMSAVSNSKQIRALIARILRRQEHLYLYMYESLPVMTLDEIPGVSILGPDKIVASNLNNKIVQYENLSKLVPMVDFRVCRDFEELVQNAEKFRTDWVDGIFVSGEYSAAGVNSIVSRSGHDILEKFGGESASYLISRFVPHVHDPTVLAVVASEDDIYIAGVADQIIEANNRFTGSFFPTVLKEAAVDRLKNYTEMVGKWMASKGYRGIFGCDFIVTADNEIFFLEINARKQGTTLEFCCTLEQSLPPGSPMLPELEFYAVEDGLLPANTVALRGNPKNLHWGTHNYKIHRTVQTDGYIPQGSGEREAFRKVANGNLKKDFLILEHTGSDFVVAEGSFIGRIVAIGMDFESVKQGIQQGKKTIELTIVEKKEEEGPHDGSES